MKMLMCDMMLKEDFHACFDCKFPDCRNDAFLQGYEPKPDPHGSKKPLFDYFGKKMTVQEAAEKIGCSVRTIQERRQNGWSDLRIAMVGKDIKRTSLVVYNGKEYTYKQIAEELGIGVSTAYRYLGQMRMTVEQFKNRKIDGRHKCGAKAKAFCYNDKSYTIATWAKALDLPVSTIYGLKNRKGFSLEQMVEYAKGRGKNVDV